MFKKVSFTDLIELVEGRLSADSAAAIRQRVAADSVLQADLTWIETFYAQQDGVMLHAPSADVIAPATALFRQKYGQNKEERPTLWQRLSGALTFDSWAGAQIGMAGARAADGSSLGTRQLIYHSEQCDIALDLATENDATDLHGTILPLLEGVPEQFSIQLLADDAEVAITRADDVGEFQFVDVADGTYQLIVSNPLFELVMDGVEIA